MQLNVIVIDALDAADMPVRHLVFRTPSSITLAEIQTFCFEEGHNEASKEWVDEGVVVKGEQAEAFVQKVQDYYNSLPGDELVLNLVEEFEELESSDGNLKIS